MKASVRFYAVGLQHDDIEVNLSDSTIEELFDDAFEGYCPVCRNERIVEDAIICCECMFEAAKYHRKTGCCFEEEIDV